MTTWLADFAQKNDLDPSKLVRYRGGVGIRDGRQTIAHFVGHPVHYFDNKEWKPITLAHNNGQFEGSNFGWNGYAVTHKGRVLYQPNSVTFNGVAHPLNFFLDAPNHRLIAYVAGVGEYQILYTEKGVKEKLIIPEPLDGLLTFQVSHVAKPPKELYKTERHVTGRDDLKGDSYLLTLDMPRGMEIDPDYSGTTGDGYIYGTHATVYATARSTSSNSIITGDSMVLGQSNSPEYRVYDAYLKIDTSGIPDADDISQVNLTMTPGGDSSTVDFDVVIRKQNWSAQDPIAAGTREAAYDGCLAATSDDSIWRNTNGIVSGTSDTSGNLSTAYVSKTSYTYYSLISSRTISATTPTSTEYITVYTQEHTTAGYRPVLTVVHASAGGGRFLSLLGVGR